MMVFDKDGVAHDKEPIDVAECVERLGWTREPPAIDASPTKPKKTATSE